jgi:hypothetical protein
VDAKIPLEMCVLDISFTSFRSFDHTKKFHAFTKEIWYGGKTTYWISNLNNQVTIVFSLTGK